MFWGLIMEPNKRYTQTVEKSFHVSMASLDIPNADDEMVQVMLCYEGRNYLLCSLKKSSTFQMPLDLNFEEGTEIAFTCNGHGHVHLTGYLIPNEDLDMDELEEEEAEDEEEQVPQLVGKQAKRKATTVLNNQEKVKRVRQEIKAESSEDDSPAELDGTNEDNESEDSDEEDLLDELEVEEEDDSEDEEEDEEEEEVKLPVQKKPTKPQQQHDKKNKQVQQQQQQQKKKPEKQQKLVNGKEIKQDAQNKQQKKNKGEQVQQQNAQSEQKKKILEGGVQIEDIRVGQGTPAKAGKFISVYYVGRLKNGKKFDATTQGDGFKFRLGRGEVIKGWDIGIQGMKTGGKRRITIPPALAYGAKGSPPVIPGNSTLLFEVELRNVH